MSQATNSPATNDPMITYWKQGHQLIEACLMKATEANPDDAPFPMVGVEAAIWHEAQAAAYLHAIEMMGYPAEATPDNILRTNEAVARLLEKQSG